MLAANLQSIENQFDADNLSAGDFVGAESLWPFFDLILKGQYQAAIAEGESLLSQMGSPFILQWMVAISETLFDLELRRELLKNWTALQGWGDDHYARGTFIFQQALTSFFAGSLRESESQFKIALGEFQQANYLRGQMQALFHLGLVARDRQDQKTMLGFFDQAAVLAESLGAKRFQRRIDTQIATSQDKLFLGIQQLESALCAKDLKTARIFLSNAEGLRRERKNLRGRESLYVYLPLIWWLGGKNRRASAFFAGIADPILKIKVLQLKAKMLSLSSEENTLLQSLKFSCGVACVVEMQNDVEFNGVLLSSIEDESVKKFLRMLFADDRAFDKTEICQQVWQIEYSPVLHDNKIHKLIHRSRGLFPSKKMIVNTYGGYRLSRS